MRFARSRSLGVAASSFDQILSSASNLLLVLLVARVADVADFANFSIAWTVVVLLLAISRGALSVHVSLSANNPAEVLRQGRYALGVTTLLAPLIFAIVVLAPWISLGSLTWTAVLLGAFAPVAVMQDVLRHERFASHRPARAITADGIWLSFVVVGVGASLGGTASPEVVVLLWGLGAATGLAIMSGSGCTPKITGMRAWLRDGGRSRSALTTSSIIGAFAIAMAAVLIGRLTSAEVVAALNGAAQLMAPINTLIAVMTLWLLPRSVSRPGYVRFRIFLVFGALLSLATLLWTTVLTFFPSNWGEAVLGQTWQVARPVLPYVGLQFAVGAFAVASGATLTSLRKSRLVLTQSMMLGGGRIFNAVAVSLAFGSAIALSMGESLVLALGALVGWFMAHRAVRSSAT